MIEIQLFGRNEWRAMGENAHSLCFAEKRSADLERCDFVLAAVNERQIGGYVTCKEIDREHVYWQFGGSFPGIKGTAMTYRGYQKLIAYCQEPCKYKYISTYVENTNIPMLKMAMKAGFRIVGTRNFGPAVMVDLLLEFK